MSGTAPAAASRRPAVAARLGPWLVAGVVAWAGVAWIGWTLWQSDPPRAGFDLALLLEAARRVLAGDSPYDPAMLAGAAPDAVELFYSYPPPVAQAMTVLAWLPDGVVLVLWAIGATLGFGWVAGRLGRAYGLEAWPTAVRGVAVAPLVLPFAIAILFGNFDAWYPLAYGALLLAVLPRAPASLTATAGIALGVISVAKLHPAPLALWVAVRAARGADRAQRRVLLATVGSGLAILAVSLLVFGVQPWIDYLRVLSVGAGTGLVDPRNIGPVSLVGQATGLDGAVLRWLAIAVFGAVVVAVPLLALRLRDGVLSLALAATATLVTLPITWYHYPTALLPFAAALAISSPAARRWLVLAAAIACVAIVWLPLTWVAVAIVVAVALHARRHASLGPAPVG